VFIAEEQSSGRGRLGRSWISPKGGLWLTLLWPVTAGPMELQTVPLVIGLAVLESIEKETPVQSMIKWPNDVLTNGRKVCGILCELESHKEVSALIIGIGVNANIRVSDLCLDAKDPVTTLLDETGVETNLVRLESDLLERLPQKLLTFEAEGLSPFLPLINTRLAWVNRTVSVSGSEAGEVRGVLRGVDERGRLVIERAGNLLYLLSGQLRASGD